MSRIQCACGRKYYSNVGDGRCPKCQHAPADWMPTPDAYTEEEEIQVLAKARMARVQGLIPPWEVIDTPRGIRYRLGGRTYTIGGFDLEMARYIRAHKGVGVPA